jgi:hypothetical protein
VDLRSEQLIAISPSGHYRGPAEAEQHLVYVVETGKGQETLTPVEFAARYEWENDPSRVTLSVPAD